MVKIIAFYLPQFHEISENNAWWGKGFTEWSNTKKAKPLFKGHYQPRVPLNENYYCLLDSNVMVKQMRLARKYGIYGFCFYHYWYCGKKLLEKPMELMLENQDANLPFCFAWANESWTKTWHGGKGKKEILIEQTYGDISDWDNHIHYLLKFFCDDRYIKMDNKPVLLVLHLNQINCLREMLGRWDEVLQSKGFDGLFLVEMKRGYYNQIANRGIRANASVDFEPGRTMHQVSLQNNYLRKWILRNKDKFEKIPFLNRICREKFDYSHLCEKALMVHHRKNEFRGIFTGYDDTPRRGQRATIVLHNEPRVFGKYLKEAMRKSLKEKNEYIFVNAWNEWGEGAYLEPDQRYGYAYLNQVKKALSQYNNY